MSGTNHPDADNVVQLTDQIVSNGSKSAEELEKKRHIVVRALQIAVKQLEEDALKIEQAAILNEMPMKDRHERMDLARALRMTTGWLSSLTGAPPEGASNAS